MSTTDTFDLLYSKMKQTFAAAIGADQKGEDLESCVEQVMAEGHDEQSAYAICNASMKAGLTDEEKGAALTRAKEIADGEDELGAVFSGVLQKAGYEFEPDAAFQPGEKAGGDLMQQTREVMARGNSRDASLVIAEATLKSGIERNHRDDLLATAKEVADYDAQIPAAFKHLIDYAGVDVKGEEDLELPKVCRKCEANTRMQGNFMCPDCHPEVDPETDEYELVKSSVQEREEGGASEKSGDEPPGEARKVYLDHGVSTAPADATVRVDDKGLYYEEPVETNQKADPMANGHDLDPATGTGTCEATGKEIEAETMGDLTNDCPHCGDALSVFDQKADPDVDQKGFGADVFRVRAAKDDDTEYDGDVLGIGVDFPESDVYVDWRREAFPDELEDPHVSIYGSKEDLEQATGNVIEHLETYETPTESSAAEGEGEEDPGV